MDLTDMQSRTPLSRPAQTNRWALWGIGAGILGMSPTSSPTPSSR